MSPVFSPAAAGALDGPQWLIDRRVAAAETFEATPRPDVSAEEWRYSRIGDLDLDAFAPATQFGDAPMARLDVEPAAIVRCVNGRVMYTDVEQELTDLGVRIGPLEEDRLTGFIPGYPDPSRNYQSTAGEGVAVDADGTVFVAEGPASIPIARGAFTRYSAN